MKIAIATQTAQSGSHSGNADHSGWSDGKGATGREAHEKSENVDILTSSLGA
jgi:hypothetical protein